LTRCKLIEDYDGTVYEVETPLSSKVDCEEIRRDLAIPDYVDMSSFQIERGLVTVWAGQNAHRMKEIFPDVSLEKAPKESIPMLFFGGAAVRMLCESANNPSGPFFRKLNDIDLIAPRDRAQEMYKFLLALGDLCGTRYHYFITRSDRRFNAMRAGKRFRVRTIESILGDGSLLSGVLDIFTDSIDLRHKVDVRDMFCHPKQGLYTIGATNVLLSKCQYIFDVPATGREELVQQGLGYRILDYPYYRDDRIPIGIEEKDVKDICALLLDCEIGEKVQGIDLNRISRIFGRDKKFALTFRLNMENILRNETFLREGGVSSADIGKVFSRIQSVLDAVPKIDKRWSDAWWNVDVETPQIFQKTPNI